MRSREALVAAGLLLASVTWGRATARAESDGSPVVARVGARTITAADLSRRLAAVPPFQLKQFGDSAAEISKNFLERVLVREALLAQAAIDQKLDQREDVIERLRAVQRNTLLGAVRAESSTSEPVTNADIKAYYDGNAAKFHAPPRLSLWRIQVATAKEAQAVLDELRKDTSTKKWNDLARDKSLDQATRHRGGNLGFVGPDGTTSEPGVRLDQAVLTAALAAKDSEIVPVPVRDGDRFSIVWRRQSMKAVDRPLELEAPSIRQVLLHKRADDRLKKLLATLRAERLSDFHPELLDGVEIAQTGDLQLARRPGTLAPSRRTSAGPAAPKPGTLR